jgi:hypothetical protein
MKWKILIFLMLLSIPQIFGALCEERMDNGSSCEMVSPILVDCGNYTYDIYYKNGTAIATNQPLNIIVDYTPNGTIGWFNFTNQTGDYIITLCDGTYREFRVTDTYDTKFQKEERSRMFISIMIMLGVMIAALILLAVYINYLPARLFFSYLAMGTVVIGINTAKIMAETNNLGDGITSMLLTAFKVAYWILYISLSAGVIYGIWMVLQYLKSLSKTMRFK